VIQLFVPIVVLSLTLAQTPLSKSQLLELSKKEVDVSLIVSLIEKDCVDFEVDAAAVLELSDLVPKAALEAAISCRDENQSLRSPNSPPGTNAQASDISLSDAAPFSLKDVRRIAVIPLMLDGYPDAALTAAYVDQMKQRTQYESVDEFQLRVHFEDSGAFHSNAPIKSLLAAARAEGADAVLVGTANKYKAFDDFAIRLDVRLVEVNRGRVLWSDGARGKSGLYSWQACKKHTARNVVKKMP
jgi:hypothetical protein